MECWQTSPITGNRSLCVDFTVPYWELRIGTIVKRESSDWLFLRPFHPILCLVIVTFSFLTGLIIWFNEHSSENKAFKKGSTPYRFGTMLWFGFSLLFNAQSIPEKNMHSWFLICHKQL